MYFIADKLNGREWSLEFLPHCQDFMSKDFEATKLDFNKLIEFYARNGYDDSELLMYEANIAPRFA